MNPQKKTACCNAFDPDWIQTNDLPDLMSDLFCYAK